MKYIKGCLFALILFIGSMVVVFFLFKNNVLNNLESYSNNVTQSWSKYVEDLTTRNAELSQQNFKSDSLKFYWNKAKSISVSKNSEELEFNEFKINKFVISDSLVSALDDKINLSLENYNQSVRAYNQYRLIFPNSLVARKTRFPRNFIYFDYRYGVNNEKEMIRKKKIKNWIINGGPYPE